MFLMTCQSVGKIDFNLMAASQHLTKIINCTIMHFINNSETECR